MINIKTVILLLGLVVTSISSADRIKDLTDVAGVRTNKLVGFGLVVGLQGSGDGKDLPLTAQGLKTMLSGLGVSVDGPVSDFDLGDQMADLAVQNAKEEIKEIEGIWIAEDYYNSFESTKSAVKSKNAFDFNYPVAIRINSKEIKNGTI